MEFLRPIKGIGDQEIGYLWTAIIIDQGSPVRVFALAWICMLIHMGAVKAGQSHQIFREMSRNPV